MCCNMSLFLDVRGISNRKHVQDGYEQVQRALHDYTVTCYPQVQVCMLITLIHSFIEEDSR